MNSVALVAGASADTLHEYDLVTILGNLNPVVPGSGQNRFEFGELVVMGREHGHGLRGTFVKPLADGPGDREAIKGRGAAADLVEKNQRAVSGVVEDVRGLDHLDEEGRLAAGEVVACADAGKQAVNNPEARAF